MSMTGKGISSKTYRAGAVEGGTVPRHTFQVGFLFFGTIESGCVSKSIYRLVLYSLPNINFRLIFFSLLSPGVKSLTLFSRENWYEPNII